MLDVRSSLPLVLALGVAACGSDPLRNPDDEGTAGRSASAGRTGSGNAGSAGSGNGQAGSGGSAPVIPDYTQSDCYGQQTQTEVYDLETHDVTTVRATCRGEGNRTLFYVDDALWETEYAQGAPPFTQADVNAFLYGYELRGRASSFRPDLGVLPTDELVFGALDEDGLTDGKLPIFLVSSGGAGQGYLCSWCDRLELHLDGPLLRSLRTDETFSIAAHETVHAIHRGYDPDEAFWIDETLAQAAMTVNGYFTDRDWVASFLQDTNQQWGPGLSAPQDFNYGAGLLFGSYLWQRGGAELLAAITQEPKNEWAGIDAALASLDFPEDAFSLFLDMALAAYLQDEGSDYHLASLELGDDLAPTLVELGQTEQGTIMPYGLVYLALDASARSITVEGSELSARIALSGSPPEVIDVPIGEEFSFDRPAEVLVLTSPVRESFTLDVR